VLLNEIIARNLARLGIRADRIVTPYGDIVVKEHPLWQTYPYKLDGDASHHLLSGDQAARGLCSADRLSRGLRGRDDHEF